MHISHHSQPLDQAAQLEATVKSIGDATEVAAQMFSPDGMVSTVQRLLDVAQLCIHLGDYGISTLFGLIPVLILQCGQVSTIARKQPRPSQVTSASGARCALAQRSIESLE